MMRRLLSSVSLLLFTLPGCRSSNQSSSVKDVSVGVEETNSTLLGLGMNDVSILMPIATVKDLILSLPVLTDKPEPSKFATGLPFAAEDGEGFIYSNFENDHFAGIPNTTLGRSNARPEENTFRSYHATGIRFVPCANDLAAKGDDSKCVRTLQIVWKPLSLDTNKVTGLSDDQGIHTIYALSTSEFKDIIQTLLTLHKNAPLDTEGLSLIPHPVIEKEGVEGPYFKGIIGLVHRYARASKLIGFASLHETANLQEWDMRQFTVAKGKLVLLPVPSLETPRTSQTFSDQAACARDIVGFPVTTSPFRLKITGHCNRGSFTPPFTDSELNEQRLKTFAINNPNLHNAQNIDCSSCHVANTTTQDIPDDFEVPANAFQSKHWNLAPNFQKSRVRLQMFSFVGNEPIVVKRVMNETASALNYLVEKKFLPRPKGWNEAPVAVAPAPASGSIGISPELGGGIQPGTSYQLVSEFSQKCLGVNGSSKSNGARYQQQTCTDTKSQAFQLTSLGNNRYTIKNIESGRCLDVVDGNKANGALIQHWDCNSGSAQVFELTSLQSAVKAIVSNRCLDIDGPSKDDLAKAQQWDCNGQSNQLWNLKKAP